ncbi:unnamed protein product, partial [Iphiclides podalirius]
MTAPGTSYGFRVRVGGQFEATSVEHSSDVRKPLHRKPKEPIETNYANKHRCICPARFMETIGQTNGRDKARGVTSRVPASTGACGSFTFHHSSPMPAAHMQPPSCGQCPRLLIRTPMEENGGLTAIPLDTG